MSLVKRLVNVFTPLADASKAEGMMRYMKCKGFDRVLGIMTPTRKKIMSSEVFPLFEQPSVQAWLQAANELWTSPYRDLRYCALDLSIEKKVLGRLALEDEQQVLRVLHWYHRIVHESAWWDFVDMVSSNGVGFLLQEHTDVVEPYMYAWAVYPGCMWTRRSAIIAQLRRTHHTDTDLLTACIVPNLDNEDFFIQKGIGWALREYSYWNPEWVLRTVEQYVEDGTIAPLSLTEGLKVLLAPNKRIRKTLAESPLASPTYQSVAIVQREAQRVQRKAQESKAYQQRKCIRTKVNPGRFDSPWLREMSMSEYVQTFMQEGGGGGGRGSSGGDVSGSDASSDDGGSGDGVGAGTKRGREGAELQVNGVKRIKR